MSTAEAAQIINSQPHIDAVLFYRRRPVETADSTFALAEAWIEAARILAAD